LSNSGCHSFVCLGTSDEIVFEKGLIKPITWKIEDKSHRGFHYDKLLAFYFLPQKASYQRDENNIKRNSPLDGPNCKIEIKFVSSIKIIFKLKIYLRVHKNIGF